MHHHGNLLRVHNWVVAMETMFPITMVIKYLVSGQAGKQTSNIALYSRNQQGVQAAGRRVGA